MRTCVDFDFCCMYSCTERVRKEVQDRFASCSDQREAGLEGRNQGYIRQCASSSDICCGGEEALLARKRGISVCVYLCARVCARMCIIRVHVVVDGMVHMF